MTFRKYHCQNCVTLTFSEILLRIGPIITLAVLNALIIYKFLRIAKRRHQLKRYSLQLPSNLADNLTVTAARGSHTTEVDNKAFSS